MACAFLAGLMMVALCKAVDLSAAPQLAAAPGAAVECLREFVALNGRRPVAGPTVSEAERTLARWAVERVVADDDDVAAILVTYPPRRGRPSTAQIPEQLNALLAPAPAFEEVSDPRLEQLRTFIAEHQHRPSASRDVVSAEEAKLYTWMITQLNRGNQQVAVAQVPGDQACRAAGRHSSVPRQPWSTPPAHRQGRPRAPAGNVDPLRTASRRTARRHRAAAEPRS